MCFFHPCFLGLPHVMSSSRELDTFLIYVMLTSVIEPFRPLGTLYRSANDSASAQMDARVWTLAPTPCSRAYTLCIAIPHVAFVPHAASVPLPHATRHLRLA
jgi:hypothetical protein